MVIELRPPGVNKGTALTELIAERNPAAVLFAGDDLGDLPAFGAVRALRAAGHPGLTVCSASGEVSELAAEADLVVAGPDEVAALLSALARSLAASPRPAR
jgi:trehalose 6-phosphate phosphatase